LLFWYGLEHLGLKVSKWLVKDFLDVNSLTRIRWHLHLKRICFLLKKIILPLTIFLPFETFFFCDKSFGLGPILKCFFFKKIYFLLRDRWQIFYKLSNRRLSFWGPMSTFLTRWFLKKKQKMTIRTINCN